MFCCWRVGCFAGVARGACVRAACCCAGCFEGSILLHGGVDVRSSPFHAAVGMRCNCVHPRGSAGSCSHGARATVAAGATLVPVRAPTGRSGVPTQGEAAAGPGAWSLYIRVDVCAGEDAQAQPSTAAGDSLVAGGRERQMATRRGGGGPVTARVQGRPAAGGGIQYRRRRRRPSTRRPQPRPPAASGWPSLSVRQPVSARQRGGAGAAVRRFSGPGRSSGARPPWPPALRSPALRA